MAEESGLISRVGEFVLREACRQAADWRARFGEDAPVPINVNLAARQLAQPDPRRHRAHGAGRRRAPGREDIGLEITESAVIENTLLAVDTLDQLKALGLQILLDDFGTGYSSLSYLQRLPIDVLKIDRSFVSPLGGDDRDEAIVAAIVGMAQALGISIVAEGVETAVQADVAAALGCGLAQGFFFHRPLPAAELEVGARRAGRGVGRRPRHSVGLTRARSWRACAPPALPRPALRRAARRPRASSSTRATPRSRGSSRGGRTRGWRRPRRTSRGCRPSGSRAATSTS